MKQNKARKLNLGKKTISRLNTAETNAMNGGSIVISGPVFSAGCATDFTRPGTSVMTGGTIIRP